MWSWVLHRITGVAIFFFLLVHILDTSLLRVSPEAYNAGDRRVQDADHGAG
jgi:succinate dehydrogenase / fumarate reductase cytochrome b subunit